MFVALIFNHYTVKMSGPLVTWTVHFTFLWFSHIRSYMVYIFSLLLKLTFPYEMSFQSPIAIWQYFSIYSNTIHNMAFDRIVSPLKCIL